MDLNTIFGLIIGIGAILIGAKLEHLPLTAIYAPTAFLIVMGGSVGAGMVSFPMSDFKRAFGEAMGVAFKNVDLDFRALIDEIIKVATVARKEGVLAIEGMRGSIQDPTLQHSLKYVIDGFEPNTVKEILENDAFIQMEEMEQAGKVWEGIGGYCPTVGIIGAVLGLIFVMKNLDNPDMIGPGIAIAFVATVYGVGFANLIFIPLGTKIKRKANLRSMRSQVITVGISGIQEGLNPHFLREKLEVYLEHHLRTKDGAKH